MQIPKTRRRQKLREKVCIYEGCGKHFFGISIAKYCLTHRDEQYRIRKRSEKSDPTRENQEIDHHCSKVESRIETCALEGCGCQFEIKIFPQQKIYPKYCEEHRSSFRRELFIKQIKVA